MKLVHENKWCYLVICEHDLGGGGFISDVYVDKKDADKEANWLTGSMYTGEVCKRRIDQYEQLKEKYLKIF